MDSWDRLLAQIEGAQEAIARPSATSYMKSMAGFANDLKSEVTKAQTAQKYSDMPRLEDEIQQLWNRLEKVDRGGISALHICGAVTVAVVLVGIGIVLWTFVSNALPGSLATINGARPLITLAAIISTVGFGASLVLAALFASDANFETRFRTAREIFLVFSGVFATVVGFHFGAGQTSMEPPSLPSVNKISYADGKWQVTVDGGTPEYLVEADFDGTKKTGKGASPVTVDLGVDFAAKTYSKVTLKIVDKGKGTESISLTNLVPNRGWEKSAVAPNVPAPGSPPPGKQP